MIGVLVIGLAIATALLAAASLRLESLVSTLLAAYLALAADLVLVVVALSPFRAVTRGGVGAAQAVALRRRARRVVAARQAAAFRSAPSGRRFGPSLGEPVAAVFLAVTAVVLAYELVLALTSQPNNWDSLTYHLAASAPGCSTTASTGSRTRRPTG